MRLRSLLPGLLLLTALFAGLACSSLTPEAAPAAEPTPLSPTGSPLPTAEPTPAPAATEPAATEPPDPAPPTASAGGESQPAAPANSSQDCPPPAEGQAAFLSLEDGFCFVYPAVLTATVTSEGSFSGVILRAARPPLNPTQMKAAPASLILDYNGPADGLDSAGYAARWLEIYGPLEAPDFQPGTIGGHPALILTNLPNFFYEHSAFVVANDSKYRLTLSPRLGEDPALDDTLRQIWQTVIPSLVFFPPQHARSFTRPEAVCPQPDADNHSYMDWIAGYCLLYPAGFTATANFPSQFTGGPVLGDREDFQAVRTSISVSYSGYFPGLTVHAAVAERMEVSDTVQDILVSGYPAISYRSVNGPWAAREASVLVNGRVYTLFAQPWEPQRWPQGLPALDLAWNTVLNSIAFFDPWR